MAGSEPLTDRLDNYDLGKNVGLTGGQEVSATVVQSVILAADKGNRGTIGRGQGGVAIAPAFERHNETPSGSKMSRNVVVVCMAWSHI